MHYADAAAMQMHHYDKCVGRQMRCIDICLKQTSTFYVAKV